MRSQKPGTYARMAVLEALVAVARPIILHYFRPDSCIGSTRLAIQALGAFDIPARPLKVRASAFNAAYLARLGQLGHFPRDAAELDTWCREYNAWSVCVGHADASGRGWNGHLVALVEQADGAGYLIDLSLDQMNRATYNITLAPQLVAVSPTFIAGHQPHIVRCNGSEIVYDVVPDDPDYKVSLDWQVPERNITIGLSIVAAMHQYLQQPTNGGNGRVRNKRNR